MEENIRTIEYLESLENKDLSNPNHAKFVNTKDLFKKAQNGDEEAFNKLYLQNEYLIDEVLAKHHDFIDTRLDIQIFKDRLTDCLIASILRFNPSFCVAFRSYATTNMYKILKYYLSSNKPLTNNIHNSLSNYNSLSSEDDLYMYQIEDNELLDDQSYMSYLEGKRIANAKDLWGKISILLNEKEQVLFYRHFALNETLEEIAESFNTTKAVISYHIVNAKNRVKREIERANRTYMEIRHNGKDPDELLKFLNTRQPEKVDYYLELYDYLFNDGKKPKAANTRGYLMYSRQKFRKNREQVTM